MERDVALAELAERHHGELLAAIAALNGRLDRLEQRRRIRPVEGLKPQARPPAPGLDDHRGSPRRAMPDG